MGILLDGLIFFQEGSVPFSLFSMKLGLGLDGLGHSVCLLLSTGWEEDDSVYSLSGA